MATNYCKKTKSSRQQKQRANLQRWISCSMNKQSHVVLTKEAEIGQFLALTECLGVHNAGVPVVLSSVVKTAILWVCGGNNNTLYTGRLRKRHESVNKERSLWFYTPFTCLIAVCLFHFQKTVRTIDKTEPSKDNGANFCWLSRNGFLHRSRYSLILPSLFYFFSFIA